MALLSQSEGGSFGPPLLEAQQDIRLRSHASRARSTITVHVPPLRLSGCQEFRHPAVEDFFTFLQVEASFMLFTLDISERSFPTFTCANMTGRLRCSSPLSPPRPVGYFKTNTSQICDQSTLPGQDDWTFMNFSNGKNKLKLRTRWDLRRYYHANISCVRKDN